VCITARCSGTGHGWFAFEVKKENKKKHGKKKGV
jgi:hypothetical protein